MIFRFYACTIGNMKKQKRVLSAIAAVLLLVLGLAEWYFSRPGPQADLDVHFIDVGQGDSILVVCNGEAMLIDGGDNDAEAVVPDYLQRQGVTHLNYIIATHPHADHVGGLDAVARAVSVDTVYTSCVEYDTKSFRDFLTDVTAAHGAVEFPEPDSSFSLGGATVTVLGPRTYNVPETWNNTSIVLRLTYGQTSFLFTGDMEQAEEAELLEAGCDVSCDVLKVGHHGSSTSSGYRLLYEAAPTAAVISCGAGNDYGHPHREALSRLNDAGVSHILRTDQSGSIVFHSDGTALTYTTEY